MKTNLIASIFLILLIAAKGISQETEQYQETIDTLYFQETPKKLPIWIVQEKRFDEGKYNTIEKLYFREQNIDKQKFADTKAKYDYLVINKKFVNPKVYYNLKKK